MSVIADFGVNGSAPSKIAGANAVQFFPRLLGPSIGVAPLTPSTTNNQGALIVPSFNAVNGQVFKVKVAGSYQTPAGTVLVELVASKVQPGVAPAYSVIAANAAVTPTASTRTSFGLDVTLIGDSDSGVVAGFYNGVANGALSVTGGTAQKALDNTLTGINFNVGGPNTANGVFSLAVRVTFGTPAAANAGSLYQFQVIAD